nr:SIR2 family protein [uncultured Flavobacterium sp.]
MSKEINRFIEDYSRELVSGNAAYFVGAGISVDSKLPNWIGLIKPFTEKIGIKDLDCKDLPLMAQYVINEDAGNRGPFINAISRELKKGYIPNRYHEAIAKTNLKTIWTTNYDNLLEEIFAKTTIDVKFSDDSISRDVPESQIEIIKMHGCVYSSHRDDIVITQSDYEDFFINKPAIAHRLRIDLLRKSFLFIGYGYEDPNIKNIIAEARRLAGNNTLQHFLITKDKPGSIEFDLWCKNLRRYGIRVIKIDNYDILLEILEKLSLKSRGKSIFITGSHSIKTSDHAIQLAKGLANNSQYILNDGQSSGLMRIVSNTFIETIITNKFDINNRIKFFPNPYSANPKFADDVGLLPLLKQWRIPLLRSTHVMIAFDGGMGTKAEMEAALELGCIIVPYFQNETMETWILLNNDLLKNRLSQFDLYFIDKIKNKNILYTDVLTVVEQILN